MHARGGYRAWGLFPDPALDEVTKRVTQDWITDRREEITEQYFADLLERYNVVVERETDALALPSPSW